MTSASPPIAPLRKKAEHELKEFAIIAGYLYSCLSSLTLLKIAILHADGISYLPYHGFAVIKAMVLAKFILIGHELHFGGNYSSRPLIWPTLGNAAAFLVLLCFLTIIEEVVVGSIHGRSISASLSELSDANLFETLARILILFLILVPYFAFRTMDGMLGDGNLTKLFFFERGSLTYRDAEHGGP